MAEDATPSETLACVKKIFPAVQEDSQADNIPAALRLPEPRLLIHLGDVRDLYKLERPHDSINIYAEICVNGKRIGSSRDHSHVLSSTFNEDFVLPVERRVGEVTIKVRTTGTRPQHRRGLTQWTSFFRKDHLVGKVIVPLSTIDPDGSVHYYALQDKHGRILCSSMKIGLSFITQLPPAFYSPNPREDHYNLAYIFIRAAIREDNGRSTISTSWKQYVSREAATLLEHHRLQRGLSPNDALVCYLQALERVQCVEAVQMNLIVVHELLQALQEGMEEEHLGTLQSSFGWLLRSVFLHCARVLDTFDSLLDPVTTEVLLNIEGAVRCCKVIEVLTTDAEVKTMCEALRRGAYSWINRLSASYSVTDGKAIDDVMDLVSTIADFIGKSRCLRPSRKNHKEGARNKVP